jgi:hypothetical protein
MPNYEIYPADILAALNVVDSNPFTPAPIDSTNYFLRKIGKKVEVVRHAEQIGRISIGITATTLYLGELHVDKRYRSLGVSNLLLFIALIYGIRKNALTVTLNEDSELEAYKFWARSGISINHGTLSSIASALNHFEVYQSHLAQILNLYHTPRTMLLNTDVPAGAPTSGKKTSKEAWF